MHIFKSHEAIAATLGDFVIFLFRHLRRLLLRSDFLELTLSDFYCFAVKIYVPDVICHLFCFSVNCGTYLTKKIFLKSLTEFQILGTFTS